MPDNSVTTNFFADASSAEAALTKLEKKYDDLQNAMKHMHREGKEGGLHLADAFREIGTMAVSATLGFTSLIGLVEKFADVSREAQKAAEDAARSGEKLQTKTSIQIGQFGAAGVRAREAIEGAAFGAGRDRGEVGALLVGLVQKGKLTPAEAERALSGQAKAYGAAFEASGGTLTPATYAGALGAMMDTRAQRTPEALGQASTDFFATIQGTSATADDITVAASTLKELGKGKGRERNQQALAQMGLSLTDVDLQGEDLMTAVGRLREGLQKIKPEERTNVLATLGDAGAFGRLMDAQSTMGERRANFGKAIEAAGGGRAAQGARFEQAKESFAEMSADDTELNLQTLELQMRRRGDSDFDVWLTRHASEALAYGKKAVGLGPMSEERFASLLNDPEGFREIKAGLQAQAGGGGAMTLDKILETMKLQLEETRKANRTNQGRPRRAAPQAEGA